MAFYVTIVIIILVIIVIFYVIVDSISVIIGLFSKIQEA